MKADSEQKTDAEAQRRNHRRCITACASVTVSHHHHHYKSPVFLSRNITSGNIRMVLDGISAGFSPVDFKARIKSFFNAFFFFFFLAHIRNPTESTHQGLDCVTPKAMRQRVMITNYYYYYYYFLSH